MYMGVLVSHRAVVRAQDTLPSLSLPRLSSSSVPDSPEKRAGRNIDSALKPLTGDPACAARHPRGGGLFGIGCRTYICPTRSCFLRRRILASTNPTPPVLSKRSDVGSGTAAM